jgi:hypothetical protein
MACKRSAVRSRLAPPDFTCDRVDLRPASPSSRGLGHHPFTVRTGVRIPVGTPILGVCLLAALRPKCRYEVLGSRYRERRTHLPRPASGRTAAAACHSVWRARGEDRPDSDADLALILAEGEGDWELVGNLAELAYDVFLERGVLIQPVPISLRHWLNPERFPRPGFLRNVARDSPLTLSPLARDFRLKAERALATARELH